MSFIFNFRNSSNYSTHVRIHTQEKPYKCKFCDMKFIQSTSRNRHEMRIHLSDKKRKRGGNTKHVQSTIEDAVTVVEYVENETNLG